MQPVDVLLAHKESIAARIEQVISGSRSSIVAALFRFNNRRLAGALQEASERGVSIRLVLDRNKYEQTEVTRDILAAGRFPFRLSYGRNGSASKPSTTTS